jgi:pyruvate,water dikinase
VNHVQVAPPRPITADPAYAAQVIVIGSGSATVRGVAPKAALLDRAAAAGLPVPDGIIVTPTVDPSRVAVPERLGDRLAVRSAFGAEDRPDVSLAGHFLTELDVRPEAVASSIDRVRASARADPSMRVDVLVMRAVDPVVAGVAFSEDGYEDDLVNAVAGRGDRLLAGHQAGQSFRLARLRRFERPAAALSPIRANLTRSTTRP